MAEPIRRGGLWWLEGVQGAWHKWDRGSKRWNPSEHPPPPPPRIVKIATAIGGLGAIVALATGATTLILALNPDLVPTREQTVAIQNVKVEPNVALNEYYSYKPVAKVIQQDALNPTPSEKLGAVVTFQFSLHGFKSKDKLPFRWTLFDADSKRRIAESEEIDPVPVEVNADRSQMDIGSWDIWVNTTKKKAKKYFVRLEVYNPEDLVRLTFQDSPVFSASVPLAKKATNK